MSDTELGARFSDVAPPEQASFEEFPSPEQVRGVQANGVVIDYLERELDVSFTAPGTFDTLLTKRGTRTVSILMEGVINQHELDEDMPLRWTRKDILRRLNFDNMGDYIQATALALRLANVTKEDTATGTGGGDGEKRPTPVAPRRKPAQTPAKPQPSTGQP